MKTVTKEQMGDVVATRNGAERTFTKQVWDLLGPNKDGWVQSVETPKELKEAKKPAKNTEDKAPIVKKMSVAAQKKADAEAAKKGGVKNTEDKASNPDDLANKIGETEEGK